MHDSRGDHPGSHARHPAVLVAVCFAAGIFLDRQLPQFTWRGWTLLSVVAVGFVIWGASRARGQVVALGLLAAGVCLGGMRHHAFWSLNSVEEVSQFFSEESRLVRLRGFVAEPPIIKPPNPAPFVSALPQTDATIITLACQFLQDGTRYVPVRGKVQVRVSGNLSDLKVADAVEVFGWAKRPGSPLNPGDFEFGDYLKQRQIRCVVSVGEPEAVIKLPGNASVRFRRRVDGLRTRAERFLKLHLQEDNAKIATALLLGSRATLPEDVRREFVDSGMMHVLALSGLHVGILALLVWGLCRLAQFPPRMATLLMLAAVLGLAIISGGRPPCFWESPRWAGWAIVIRRAQTSWR